MISEKCQKFPKNHLENGTRKIQENLKLRIMSSKAEILQKIKQNQPSIIAGLPNLDVLSSENPNVLETYKTVLKNIGGEPVEVAGYQEILDFIRNNYAL